MKVDNITLMMFVLNFVEFLFILVIFMKVTVFHVDACVEFCFLKRNLTINMQLLLL